MAKSPIEHADADQPPKRARQPRSKPLDGVNLRDVMKARAEQDRVLHARLKQIDTEIQALMNEHDKISEVLGIVREPQQPADNTASADDSPKWTYTCADCGGHGGPDARGDCRNCGAGPFEQAQ